jgi:large subunit ribosomal protein L1
MTEELKKNEEVIADAPAEVVETPVEDTKDEVFAKSGKRSKKVVEEVKAEEERQERIVSEREAPVEEIKKGPRPVTRPRIERRGKKYQEAAKKIDAKKTYGLEEAVKLAVATSPVKFDATVELHARLNVDPRQADQNIRAVVQLPNGTGKTVRVAVFAPEDQLKGLDADIKGDTEFLKQLDKEQLDFDVLISTPAYMPKLGKYARLLGPKGLMPNPKTGTVATDLKKAVDDAKGGKVEYRVDKQSIIHLGVGKVSFGDKKILENVNAVLESLKGNKPSTIKGAFVKSLTLTTSQGPSVRVENAIG